MTTARGAAVATRVVAVWNIDRAMPVAQAVPIIPMAHQYLLTKPIAGLPPALPTMRDPDNLVYFREETGGLCMGGYERDPDPWSLDGLPTDFNGKLLPPDWPRFAAIMEGAVRRVPAMADAEVTRISLQDYPLPIYDADFDARAGQPANAIKLKHMIMAHHGVFITSPEYSASVTPLLKNAIDWVSRVREPGEQERSGGPRSS